MGCRSNGLSELWAVGIMGCRSNGLSELWAVGIMLRILQDKVLLGKIGNIWVKYFKILYLFRHILPWAILEIVWGKFHLNGSVVPRKYIFKAIVAEVNIRFYWLFGKLIYTVIEIVEIISFSLHMFWKCILNIVPKPIV
jgi:hypothetical protein